MCELGGWRNRKKKMWATQVRGESKEIKFEGLVVLAGPLLGLSFRAQAFHVVRSWVPFIDHAWCSPSPDGFPVVDVGLIVGPKRVTFLDYLKTQSVQTLKAEI